jgi:hypothetical protein
MKYRVVEYRPNVYAIQTKSRWWPFWTYHKGDYGVWTYMNLEEAMLTLCVMRHEDSHTVSVVREL